MVVMRIAVLCACGLALGGCLSPVAYTGSYAALPPLAASDAAPLPPVTEPGQLLKPNLGRTAAGADPADDLRSSERARIAWSPLEPKVLARAPTLAAHGVPDPTKTASITQSSKTGVRRAARAQSYDREKAMDRLEREGRQNARPICGGC
jgi:hypothetical protein